MDKSYNLYMFCKKTGGSRQQAEKEYYKWKEEYLKPQMQLKTSKRTYENRKGRFYKQYMVYRSDSGIIYDNAKEAALGTGTIADSIRSCCNGTVKSYKGMIWKYIKSSKNKKGMN